MSPFLTLALDVEASGQFWFQVPYPLGKGSAFPWIGSWVCFKAILGAKKEIFSLLAIELPLFIVRLIKEPCHGLVSTLNDCLTVTKCMSFKECSKGIVG